VRFLNLSKNALRSGDQHENTMPFEDYVDDTMPLPTEVEREFFGKGTDEVSAIEWLPELEIDPAPVLAVAGRVACIQWTMLWDSEAERYQFHIYSPDHIGPKGNQHFAMPIMRDGVFADLLLINVDCVDDHTRACWSAPWLGGDELGREKVIRLHRDPLEWLESGCRGVCHLEPISRQALKQLREADTILCGDMHTAVEAWDWAFGAEEVELSRFVIDATPYNIRAYFDRLAECRAINRLRQSDLWPRGARA
jgi:hypothetical protein